MHSILVADAKFDENDINFDIIEDSEIILLPVF